MSDETDILAEIEAIGEKLRAAKTEIARRVIGQDDVVDLTLNAILSGGHALLVGAPGLAKTRLVETLGVVGPRFKTYPVYAGSHARRYSRCRGDGTGSERGAQLSLYRGADFLPVADGG